MRKKVNKTSLNLYIDPRKKALFESLKENHNTTFSEFLENSIDAYFQKNSPESLLKIEIEDLESEISFKSEKLLQLKRTLSEIQYTQTTIFEYQNRKNSDSSNKLLSKLDSLDIVPIICTNPGCSKLIWVTRAQKKQLYAEFVLRYGRIELPHCSKACKEGHMKLMSESELFEKKQIKDRGEGLVKAS